MPLRDKTLHTLVVRAMRDKPNEVLALDLDLDLAVRFDSREELSSDCKPDHEWAECMQCWRVCP